MEEQNKSKFQIAEAGKGNRGEKKIRELSEAEIIGLELMGSAYGIDLGHCTFIAHRHCPDFWSRVDGYRVLKDEPVEIMEKAAGRQYIAVEFYE